MNLGLRLLRSNVRQGEPGHVSLMIDTTDGHVVKGFWPLASALPEGLNSTHDKLVYLKKHVVPGVVVDDLLAMRRKKESSNVRLIERTWPTSAQQTALAVLKATSVVFPPYSLRPDKFPGSENCVSWAVRIINQPLVPSGPLPDNPRGNISVLERYLSIDQPHQNT